MWKNISAPTFEITFKPLEGSYTFNDSVRVQGSAKTFSGVAVQGSSIKYSITRVQPYWWEWREGGETTLTSDEAVLDEKGDFVIPFRLIPDLSDDLDECYYTYKVKATLTDAAGETQLAETSVSVGSASLVLSTDMEDEMCRDKAISATFKAENLSQKPVNVEGTYQLFTKGNKKPVLEGKFVSNKLQELVAWKELPSGQYNLILSALDEKGRKATSDKLLVLYSVSDKQSPVSKPMWFKKMSGTFAPGKPVTILFGSREKDVHVLYDVFAGGKRIESRRLALSDAVQRFDIPYKDEYGDGIYVNFCFVKNGQVYQQGKVFRKLCPIISFL